ncbi:hypothetical protein BpHYR1_038744 [Brachionus plicatilis]|uniref:CCHC-type domain-containing protein n=1 Tax=Brachionus plicatilis TaxID=10195 RepID=A0A3M7Q7P1_BRAPC|nr:hypothetical protein BpHYR1_038744 [Brachionus plicatilis]
MDVWTPYAPLRVENKRRRRSLKKLKINNEKTVINFFGIFLGLMSTDNSDDSFLTLCKIAIRIRVSKNRLDIVNRLTILNSLKQIDNGSIIPFIKTVTTTKRNIWLISFNAQYPEATFKSFAFKFVGLKPNFSEEKIAKHIISKGVGHEEIEKIYEEYFQEEEFKHISKGTFRAKIKINVSRNPLYKNLLIYLVEQTQIDGNPIGETRCLYCKQTGHKVFDCPSKNAICSKCNRAGHSSDKCSMAKIISQKEYIDLDDEDEENFDNRIITEIEVDDTNQNEAPTISSLIADFSLSKNDNMTVLGKSNKFYKRTFNDTSLNSNDQSENHSKQAKNDESVREVMSGSEAEYSIESNDDAEIKDGNSKYSSTITLPAHNETNSSSFDQQKQTADLIVSNYTLEFKPRNKHGGGVAILVKEELELAQDFSYDEFSFELLCIKINRNCKNYVLGGDLNAKTKQIGCKGENENGTILESITNELNFTSQLH